MATYNVARFMTVLMRANIMVEADSEPEAISKALEEEVERSEWVWEDFWDFDAEIVE